MKLNYCEFSQQTFYRKKEAHLQHFQHSGDAFVQEEIKSIISVMFEIRIKRNKAGKGIDLKLYNVTFNI